MVVPDAKTTALLAVSVLERQMRACTLSRQRLQRGGRTCGEPREGCPADVMTTKKLEALLQVPA